MFQLTQLPTQWADVATLTLLAGAGVTAVALFARWLWAEGRVARRWLRRPRPLLARVWVVGKLAAKAARLAALTAFVTWTAPVAVGVHTFRQLYVIDASQVAAVEVEVTDYGPRAASRGSRPPPRRLGTAVLADPAEVEAVVSRLEPAGRSESRHTRRRSSVGRTYALRFRGHDGRLQPEWVRVNLSKTLTEDNVETDYGRSGWPFGVGLSGPYTNPALGRWLEAVVAVRLPGEP